MLLVTMDDEFLSWSRTQQHPKSLGYPGCIIHKEEWYKVAIVEELTLIRDLMVI